MDEKKNQQQAGHDAKERNRSDERSRSGDQTGQQQPGQQPGHQQQGHQQHQSRPDQSEHDRDRDSKEHDPKKDSHGVNDVKPPENRMNRDK
ncbi:MAG: hypothetical protein ACYDC3_12035 [Candidatus Binataceae bacterium]